MEKTLRPYQLDAVNNLRQCILDGKRRIVLQSPTGSGKTKIATHIIKKLHDANKRTLFMVHRIELLEQAIEAFQMEGISFGIIASDYSLNMNRIVQICMVPTLTRRKEIIPDDVHTVIWDECHHIVAKSWLKIFNQLKDAFHLGLTATPQRKDGKGLKDVFSKMVKTKSIKELTELGYLVPYRIFVNPHVHKLKDVSTIGGDYNKKQLEKVMNSGKSFIVGNAINSYKKHAYEKKGLLFTYSTKNSREMAEEFNKAGIRAVHIDSKTKKDIRKKYFQDFKLGKIKILCNVDIFSEGVDVPDVEVVIGMRPTKSLTIYLQQIGRALRPSKGKDYAVIFDHANNCHPENHGLPDDERDWSLDGRKKKKKEVKKLKAVKSCPKCGAESQPIQLKICSFCGYIWQISYREVDEVKGNLIEIDKNTIRIKKRQSLEEAKKNCKTLDDWVTWAKKNDYKEGFGKIRWQFSRYNPNRQRKYR